MRDFFITLQDDFSHVRSELPKRNKIYDQESIMKLRGIEFGNVLGASGVQGFFGEGYWFHSPWKLLGMNLKDMAFVAKTATFHHRTGNMALTADYRPRDFLPSCVVAKPMQGLMLNSVGLSNPGIVELLNTFKWQSHPKPFWISLMSVADTKEARLDELKRCIIALELCKPHFKAPFGLQINLSCPNTTHDPHKLIGETVAILEAASKLDVPLMPKFSIASAPITAIMELDQLPFCDAICVSNTIPFGWSGINWETTWGSKVSPLIHLGGGGLSGTALSPLVCRWIKRLRDHGFTKHINGGGGILSRDDVMRYHQAGANSIFLGSVVALRPWRVRGIIKYANELTWPSAD